MNKLMSGACVLAGAIALGGCSAKSLSRAEANRLEQQCLTTLERLRDEDRTFRIYEQAAHGMAVFPTVGKGGALYVGGASGSGLVFENGDAIGSTRLTQATLGFQFGGQAFSQVIIFEDEAALERFTAGNFEFGAQASAVAAEAGAASGVQFRQGMATFIMAKGGLMYEATIGGQQFDYTPLLRDR